MKKYIIACGGTGGHLFPGLAAADRIRAAGHEVELWVSGRAVESSALESGSDNVRDLGTRPLPLRRPLAAFRGLTANTAAYIKARRRIRESSPAALLAMGSYTSLAPALAARAMGVPLALHEANAVPGRAIAFLSRFADCTAISFAETAAWLPNRKTTLTGMPVRADISADSPPLSQITPGPPAILVMGGSQGAHALNFLALDAMRILRQHGVLFQIIHLTGKADEDRIRAGYKAAAIPAQVFGFRRDIAPAYAAADLALSRSGAASCAELCVRALPALLVPLPKASRDHQTANARILERAGAAECLPQEDLTPDILSRKIHLLLSDLPLRKRMGAAMKALAVPDADIRLAELVMETGESRQDADL